MAGYDIPIVASIIPVLNEQNSIIKCLQSLCDQTISDSSHIIYVLDGGSEDSTWDIVESFIESRGNKNPKIILEQNPGKYVAQARNMALKLVPESVEFLLEVIGHSTLAENHIEVLLEEFTRLKSTEKTCIGALGVKVEGQEGDLGLVESWIESAFLSPLGRGNGQFSNFTGTIKTSVPAFCLHSRKALDEIGGWDTFYITSQDSDLSMRMLDAGFSLYKTDLVTVSMSKRSSLKSWAKMGFRYGFWRTKIIKKHPKRISGRELLPWFGFILTLSLLLSKSQYWFIPPIAYSIVLIFEAFRIAFFHRKPSVIIGLPLAILILHVTFSLGLMYGIAGKVRSFNDREAFSDNIQ